MVMLFIQRKIIFYDIVHLMYSNFNQEYVKISEIKVYLMLKNVLQ